MLAHAHVPSHVPIAVHRQLRWLAGGLAVGFLVPFLFADLLGLQRDGYYAVYSLVAFGFFAAWARSSHESIWGMLHRRPVTAILLGLACAAALSLVVLRQDATASPHGATLAAAVLWRGVVYGLADGLLLSSFPILAVFAAFADTPGRHTRGGRLRIGALALAASMAMTAAYHAGYSDFRSGKVANPIAGDVLWSVPTLVTLNPIGAPIAHAGMHVTAVLHAYHTDLFLPPH